MPDERATMLPATLRRNVLLALVGAAALVLKPSYRGPLAAIVHDHGGNVVASFATFFVASIGAAQYGLGRAMTAVAALLVVEVFEVTDGFGVMSNVFDPWDLAANAAGILLAFAVDALLASRSIGR